MSAIDIRFAKCNACGDERLGKGEAYFLPCGCHVEYDVEGDSNSWHDRSRIVFCDLHEAAEDLLKTCEALVPWANKVAADQPEDDPTGLAARAMRVSNSARAVIAKARKS